MYNRIQTVEYDEINEHAPDSIKNDDEKFDITGSHNEMADFQNKMKQWSIKHNITRRALNDLLSILIMFGCTFMPKDSRTFFKTPRKVPIDVLSKGSLWYYGVKIQLEQILRKIFSSINILDTIHLDFNFDGVELFDGSNKCFWPMIASIRGIFLSNYTVRQKK